MVFILCKCLELQKLKLQTLNSRDAVGISEINDFKIEATEESQLLFIEVPLTFSES